MKAKNVQNLGALIGRAQRANARLLDKVFAEEQIGCTREQWIVLSLIDAKYGISQSALTKSLNKNRSSVTSLLVYLESKGCISRKEMSSGRKLVKITEKGITVRNSARHCVDKVLKIMTKNLSPQELQITSTVLTSIIDSVSQNT